MDISHDTIPEWEYEDHPNYLTVGEACQQIINELVNDIMKQDEVISDTRESHKRIFSKVTLEGQDYLAGNYRGASYKFLEKRPVYIGGYEGSKPEDVHEHMIEFTEEIISNFKTLCTLSQTYTSISKEQKLLVFCRFLSISFVKFLAIHPYANGNGHISRLLVWIFLQKENLNQGFWSVANRPGIPRGVPLDWCINKFRQGDPNFLPLYFLQGIMTGMPVTQENFKPNI